MQTDWCTGLLGSCILKKTKRMQLARKPKSWMAKEEGETPLGSQNESIILGVNVCVCYHQIALKSMER